MSAVPLDIPGSDLHGIQYGVDFMKKANLGEELEVGTDVVVIGGGYTAMDCARTSLRHGAQNVTIAYRRTRSELVVDEEELGETEREGVRMDFLVSPVELIGDEDGKLSGVKFVRNKLVEAKQQKAGILLLSEDLDEILVLSDWVAPIYEGKFMDIIPGDEANRENVGAMMAGIGNRKQIADG